MVCGIDRILTDAKKTIQDAETRLIQELAADFDLEVETEEILQSREARELKGAMETFAVWLAHGRELTKEEE
ncbi:MAG: hypothetical protein HQL52_01635 [Magnetococcales bacterium]|nr:hypothetical protein [Magnetococcales bacterium]